MKRKNFIARNENFACEHCGREVKKIEYGGSYRNHCPYCLYSKHVDGEIPGDRVNPCQNLMEPIGVFQRRTGEYVLVHKCEKCHFERFNRIAADDDFDLVTRLAKIPVRKPL